LDYREAGADCPGLFSIYRAMIGMEVEFLNSSQNWCAASGGCNLDESFPVSAIGPTDLPDHEVIAGIHGADFDLFVGKDHDDAALYVNDHLLVGLQPVDGKFLELLKIRFATPSGGIARINVNRDQLAVRLHTHDQLAFIGAPRLAQTWRYHPGAKEIAALHWPAVVNRASTAARRAVAAPRSRRFGERVNPNELAT
jgi:hypothetical protein